MSQTTSFLTPVHIIVANAKHNKIQAIQYRDDTVFVISEEQYLRLINT
jgi:hypothetical protein